MKESLQVLFVHKVFGDLLRSDGFVGYDDVGGEFGGIVFPGSIIIDGSEGVGQISSDK